MKIAIIYNNDIPCTMGGFYVRAFQSLGYEVTHFELKNSKKFFPHFDLYFRIDHGDYADPDIPEHLKPAIFYAIDTHLKRSRKQTEKFIQNYDAVFCAHYLGMKKWKQGFGGKNIYWLPAAYDSNVHRKNSNIKEKFDIAFVGSPGGNPRKFILQLLKERYPESYLGKYPFLHISEIYSASKIGFNFSIYNDMNMRIFETMGCETLLITNEIKDPMLTLLFKENEDVILYRSLKELWSKIEYFLTHDKERKEIALNGYQKVKSQHTYTHRVKDMMEIFKNLGFGSSSPDLIGGSSSSGDRFPDQVGE